MAETKKQPFHATVSETTANGFKIQEREGVEFVYSKPEWRKDPFHIPGVGDKVEITSWNKDKKDSNIIWISSISITEFADIPEEIFEEEKESESAPPPVGKFAKKEEYNKKDRKIVLQALCKSIAPSLIASGVDDPQQIWDYILQHEKCLNEILDK